MRKQDRQQRIRDRAENALLDLYHNATPRYPRLNDQESEIFESWFSDYATFEIMDFWKDHPIAQYGRVYTWGRGGRTLAPDDLIRTHGGSSFSINVEPAQEWPISKVVELTLIVESFNAYVEAWNKGIPEAWKEWADMNPELFSDPLEEDCHV